MNGEYDHRKTLSRELREVEADRDHWKARALDAEGKVDGQAWDDLTAELTHAEGELERYNADLERAESALAKIALEVSTPRPGITEALSPEEIYERVVTLTAERDAALEALGAARRLLDPTSQGPAVRVQGYVQYLPGEEH